MLNRPIATATKSMPRSISTLPKVNCAITVTESMPTVAISRSRSATITFSRRLRLAQCRDHEQPDDGEHRVFGRSELDRVLCDYG